MNQQSLQELMAYGFTGEEFKAHLVSKDIKSWRIDTNKPEYLMPIDYPELNTLFC